MQSQFDATPSPAEQPSSQSILQRVGIGSPFATRWLPGLIIGPLVYYAYRLLVGYLNRSVDPYSLAAYYVPIVYGLPVLPLVGALLLQRQLSPDMRLLGRFTGRDYLIGACAVVLAYCTSVGLSIGLGYGREFSMVMLGFGLTSDQYKLMILSLLVLPPIVEEICFRHFILGVLPYKRNRYVAALAVVASAGFFMYSHFAAYSHWPTLALMFILGVILAVARLRSGGLLLPITLHSTAVATALLLNAAWAHLLRA